MPLPILIIFLPRLTLKLAEKSSKRRGRSANSDRAWTPDLLIVLIAAALCVRYWRIAIPLIVIAALTLTVLGAIEGLNAFYRIVG
jgi:multidrug efflux pump subunit AcrB